MLQIERLKWLSDVSILSTKKEKINKDIEHTVKSSLAKTESILSFLVVASHLSVNMFQMSIFFTLT